jgi:hypothetical protein
MQTNKKQVGTFGKRYRRAFVKALVHPSIQTAVLNRLGDMFRRDLLAAFDVGYRPRHFQV